MAIRIAVAASETSRDPMQPRRLLKKKNKRVPPSGCGADDHAVPTCAEGMPRTVVGRRGRWRKPACPAELHPLRSVR